MSATTKTVFERLNGNNDDLGRTWYRIRGYEVGTRMTLDSEYGMTPSGQILDGEGFPLTPNDPEMVAVGNVLRRGVIALEPIEQD